MIRITRVRFRGSNMFEDSGRIGTVVIWLGIQIGLGAPIGLEIQVGSR